MNEKFEAVITWILFFIGLFALTFLIVSTCDNIKSNAFDAGYKTACQDFYQGQLKMDLIKNEDGTVEWKKGVIK